MRFRTSGRGCKMQKSQHKLFAAFAAVIFAGTLLAGCGEPQESSSAGAERSREDRIADSLVSTGNTNRLNRVFEKAQNGEDVTIAYVGGSITEGYAAGAQSPDCYALLSAAEFESNYCAGGKVNCQNNGLSGTPSVLGFLRADSEVLASEPDIVFIEFAVNDGLDAIYGTAYESLVRTCLEAPNEPAVILLFTYMENGHTCQDVQQAIGEYYDLGMISVRDAIAGDLESGAMKWNEYGADDVHPSVEGHRLIADMVAHYFAEAKAKKPDKSYAVPEEGTQEGLFRNGRFCDATNTLYRDGSWVAGSHNNHFRAGFVFQKEAENEPLVMNVTGKSLFVVYKKFNDQAWGLAGVYVNDELAGILNANGPNGWGGPQVDLIETYDSVQDLHVEIRMLDDQTEKSFEVLALGVCE